MVSAIGLSFDGLAFRFNRSPFRAQSKSIDLFYAAQRAEDIMHRMETELELKPDHITYTSVLNGMSFIQIFILFQRFQLIGTFL